MCYGGRIEYIAKSAGKYIAAITAAAFLTGSFTGCAEVTQALADATRQMEEWTAANNARNAQMRAEIEAMRAGRSGQRVAQRGGGAQNVLAAVQRKVAAGADAQTLRQELSRVMDDGCYEDAHYDDWGCFARAYAPAAAEDRLEAVRFLLDNGVDVNQKNGDKATPLEESLSLLCTERLVIRDANDNIDNAAIEAARARMSKISVLLVSRGANVNGKGGSCSSYEGESTLEGTPLGMAASYGSAELVSILLEKGAKVNKSAGRYYDTSTPDEGEDIGTPLSLAVEDGRAEIVRLLLAKGAKDKTALGAAQEGFKYANTEVKKSQFKEIINMLKAAGAGKSGKKAATKKKR